MGNKETTVYAASPDKLINNVTSQKKVPFAVVEAYKSIRTNLIAILEKEHKKIFTVSSPNASEGKSTTSINTAISLSQLNKKVILVDTDAHRPSIHNKLKLNNDKGLMSIISGDSALEESVIKYNPFLDVLTVGPIPQNATEAFSTPAFDALLADIREKYDYVILDAPPVNLLSDALVIAQKSDGMVLIIRAGITTHESLHKALSSAEVLDINILGVILNGSEYGTKRYYKKYYNSYNYKYKY